MQITAVVVTHNRPTLLAQVIDALQRQTRRCDEIIVVDNASAAETQSMLAATRGITVLRSERNLGGTGGFSWGIEQACMRGCDWIWLLDDDAIPRPDALGELVNALRELPSSTGAVCGTVREFGDIAVLHRRMFNPLTGQERSIPRQDYGDKPVAIDTGSFVGFLVASRVVGKIGLPDTAFFIAYDDTEYSLRLKQAGFGLWLVPTSIVDHLRTQEARLRASDFGRKHYFNIRNRIVVKRRYASLQGVSGVAASLFGIAMWLRSKDRFRAKSRRILAQALADGYQGQLGNYPASLEALEQVSPPVKTRRNESADAHARSTPKEPVDQSGV